jgi:hypothetical protein
VVRIFPAGSADDPHLAREWNDVDRGGPDVFSFFTLLTNLIAAAVLSADFIAPKGRWGRQLSRSITSDNTYSV